MDPLYLSRRSFLAGSLYGVGGLAAHRVLNGIEGPVIFPNHTPTAKRMIVIYMLGGLANLELFDEKPLLREKHGDDLPASLLATGQITTVTSRQGALPVVGAATEFKRYGECGMNMATIIPELGRHADKLTLIRSMQTDSVVHERATLSFFTGTQLLGRPSMGSWVTYGLGSENKDLPEFVVMTSGRGDASALNPRFWGAGFLPGHHQGVEFRGSGDPVLFLKSPPGVDEKARDSVLAGIKDLNDLEREKTGDPSIETRIKSYEKAARMQLAVPELTDVSKEDKETLERYGADPKKASFGRNCLIARRLLERDVRFVQLVDKGWDHHQGLPKIVNTKAESTDKPIGALIDDLEANGLLDETLIVMAGEFGRTPYCEGRFTRNSYGRDHNNRVGALVMLGGGVKGGNVIGETDEWGWDTVKDPIHVNDVQATILHCLGVDHEKLVYRHEGRDFRLTDVAGRVMPEALA